MVLEVNHILRENNMEPLYTVYFGRAEKAFSTWCTSWPISGFLHPTPVPKSSFNTSTGNLQNIFRIYGTCDAIFWTN